MRDGLCVCVCSCSPSFANARRRHSNDICICEYSIRLSMTNCGFSHRQVIHHAVSSTKSQPDDGPSLRTLASISAAAVAASTRFMFGYDGSDDDDDDVIFSLSGPGGWCAKMSRNKSEKKRRRAKIRGIEI